MTRHPRPPDAPGTDTPPVIGGIEPMLSVDDLARILSGSRRTVERMRSAGKLPRPDLHLGKCPRWRPDTVRAWIADQARGRGRDDVPHRS